MTEYGTPFQETEALLAVANDDLTTAEAILREMLPNELESLRLAARELADVCGAAARVARRQRTEIEN